MSTRAHHPGRRRWIMLGAGLALAGVITVTMMIRLTTDRPSAGPMPTPATTEPAATVLIGSSPPGTTSARAFLPGSSPTDSRLVGGQTDHLIFARLVAQAVLAYQPSTDFQARNDDLLRAAAPAPYGDATQLAQDLIAFTPAGPALESIHAQQTTVSVDLTDVAVSEWAAKRLKGIGASPGVYGIDITGLQTIVTKAGDPTHVAVQLGLTVACPPATAYCTLDRVLPRHLQDALGSG